MRKFGEKLRALRRHHNLTLQSLAEKLGYTSHSYLSEIEAGRKVPTVQFALKVSDLFDVSLDELLKDDIEMDITG